MTRTELYNSVWKEPVQKVAEGLGISDRGLAAICIRFNIPTPPRGYWRRVQTGQKLQRPVLPNAENDIEVPLTLAGARRLGVPLANAVAKSPLAVANVTSPVAAQVHSSVGKTPMKQDDAVVR